MIRTSDHLLLGHFLIWLKSEGALQRATDPLLRGHRQATGALTKRPGHPWRDGGKASNAITAQSGSDFADSAVLSSGVAGRGGQRDTLEAEAAISA